MRKSATLRLDVRDANAVGAALADVRREWGPIHGVIHAAGVLADKLIADLSPNNSSRVLRPKWTGCACCSTQPRRIPSPCSAVLVSRRRYGNRGQAAYAMANEVLNRVAQAEAQRRGESCVVRSIDWGPWEGGMVTPALAKHFAEMNVPLIGLAAGARAFVKELLERRFASGSQSSAVPLSTRRRSCRFTFATRNASASERSPHSGCSRASAGGSSGVAAARRRGARPSHASACCIDVKVLRGIRLEGFHNGGNLLTVRQRGRDHVSNWYRRMARATMKRALATQLYPMLRFRRPIRHRCPPRLGTKPKSMASCSSTAPSST